MGMPARLRRGLLSLLGLLLVVVLLFPLVWMLASSFKPLVEIMTSQPQLLPKNPTVANYAQILWATSEVKNFPRFVMNSLQVSLGTMMLTLILATLGGYGLSRFRYRGKQTLSRLMLFIYVFPAVPLLIPVYKLMTRVGLFDTHWALILVNTTFAAPFCTWLLTSFFRAIPKELEEAAEVDGATPVAAFIRIVLPLAAPGLVTIGAYSLITAWGEYMFASVLVIDNLKKTAPLGLATYMADQYIEWGPLSAGAVLVVLPVLLLFYPVAQRFIQGFIAGAVKS